MAFLQPNEVQEQLKKYAYGPTKQAIAQTRWQLHPYSKRFVGIGGTAIAPQEPPKRPLELPECDEAEYCWLFEATVNEAGYSVGYGHLIERRLRSAEKTTEQATDEPTGEAATEQATEKKAKRKTKTTDAE